MAEVGLQMVGTRGRGRPGRRERRGGDSEERKRQMGKPEEDLDGASGSGCGAGRVDQGLTSRGAEASKPEEEEVDSRGGVTREWACPAGWRHSSVACE